MNSVCVEQRILIKNDVLEANFLPPSLDWSVYSSFFIILWMQVHYSAICVSTRWEFLALLAWRHFRE